MIIEGLMNLMKENPIRIPVDTILATDADLLKGLFMIFAGLCSLKSSYVNDIDRTLGLQEIVLVEIAKPPQ